MYFENTREVMQYNTKYIKGNTLDYGCGKAKYKNIIKQYADDYITMDLFKGDNVDIAGDVLNPPFNNNTFDTVICTQVLEHVINPFEVVKQINRILKPGVTCILTAPFICPYHPDPIDCFRYSPEGLRQLFLQNSFDIIETNHIGKTFTAFRQFIYFIYFSPYKPYRRGSYRIMKIATFITEFLNKFVDNKIIFSDSNIVARKK